MPELPEVETVVRTLERQIKDAEITGVNIRWPRVVDGDPSVFSGRLLHQHFRSFQRRGKYLLFGMDDLMLVVHLRMEGKFYIQSPKEPLNRHIHILFDLADGRQLRYHDTRKFGRMSLADLHQDMTGFHNLGPEPFSDAFSPEYVHEVRMKRNTPIKTLLLDQSFVAGIGNIYADEICFACGLRPGKNCRRLTRKDDEALVRETRRILKDAVAAGGTTIRSYTSSLGVTGLFQLQCKVHAQSVCGVCGSTIHHKKTGGRTSYYCPNCQK